MDTLISLVSFLVSSTAMTRSSKKIAHFGRAIVASVHHYQQSTALSSFRSCVYPPRKKNGSRENLANEAKRQRHPEILCSVPGYCPLLQGLNHLPSIIAISLSGDVQEHVYVWLVREYRVLTRATPLVILIMTCGAIHPTETTASAEHIIGEILVAELLCASLILYINAKRH